MKTTCFKLPKIALLTVLLAGGVLSVWAKPKTLKVGDIFPDLTKAQLEGKLPADLRGKVVLVDFWASWCAPCKASFPVLEELQKQYGTQLVVLAVSVDDKPKPMNAFLKDHPVTFITMWDARHTLVSEVDIATMPSSFILDGTGKVKAVHAGFHGASTKEQYQKEIEALLKSPATK